MHVHKGLHTIIIKGGRWVAIVQVPASFNSGVKFVIGLLALKLIYARGLININNEHELVNQRSFLFFISYFLVSNRVYIFTPLLLLFHSKQSNGC